MKRFCFDDTFKHDECAEIHKRLILQKKCKIKDDCSICLDSLFMKSVIFLPCKHYFHHQCLNQSVNSKIYTCPLCRFDLIDPLLKTGFKFPVIDDFESYDTSYISLLLNDWLRVYDFNNNLNTNSISINTINELTQFTSERMLLSDLLDLSFEHENNTSTNNNFDLFINLWVLSYL